MPSLSSLLSAWTKVLFAYKMTRLLHAIVSLQLKNKVQTLKATLDAASQYHSKEKQKYFQLGDNCQKLREKSDVKVNRTKK